MAETGIYFLLIIELYSVNKYYKTSSTNIGEDIYIFLDLKLKIVLFTSE